jgi:hypothetical protein
MIGFHSDMMWLPEHGIAAVILTNGDPGWLIRSIFRRKLLEVLFDGRPEADGQIAAASKTFFDEMAGERKLLTVPADAAEAGKLAVAYANPAVGEIVVRKKGAATAFDFGEWSSEVASRKNPDGTTSFITTVPGFMVSIVLHGTPMLRDACTGASTEPRSCKASETACRGPIHLFLGADCIQSAHLPNSVPRPSRQSCFAEEVPHALDQSSSVFASCSSRAYLARTWHIRPDGTGDAPTIRAGIDSAAAGDTVLLGNGVFTEPVTATSIIEGRLL